MLRHLRLRICEQDSLSIQKPSLSTALRVPKNAAIIPREFDPAAMPIRALQQELGSSVELEGFLVGLDRIALRFPACQSTPQEFDP